MRVILSGLMVIAAAAFSWHASAQSAEPWQAAYAGEDATGQHVIALWHFDEDGDTIADASGNNHTGTLQGVVWRPDGRFGGCIESFPGWPVEDVRHAVQITNAPSLSPQGAFTVEMWLCPAETFEGYEEAFILDKKYVAHTDYQWVLEKPDALGQRRMRLALGFGAESETWWSSESAAFPKDTWAHVAFSYDGAGTVHFVHNGRSLGKSTKPGRGSICPGDHVLSLGDRVGSYYHGFPGRMDEIRITQGVREFRPLTVAAEHPRTAYLRMEPAPVLQFRLLNMRRDSLTGATATVSVPGLPGQTYPVPELAAGASHLEYPFDTRLRPGVYPVTIECRLGDAPDAWSSRESYDVTLVPRKPPFRMPVVMWGSAAWNRSRRTSRAQGHRLYALPGIAAPTRRSGTAGARRRRQRPGTRSQRRMLDEALVNDLGIVISLGLRTLAREQAGVPASRPRRPAL